MVPALAEHRRAVRWFEDPEAFRAAVRRAFEAPHERAVPEWEPITALRDRLVPAVRRILATHDGDLVLAGHGTAWTLLVAELTGRAPDLDAWARAADARPAGRRHAGGLSSRTDAGRPRGSLG